MPPPTPPADTRAAMPAMERLTHLMYALHAISALSGLMSPAFVVTAFVTGWPSLIAVALNVIKRGQARGTWLESHLRWQLRTFGYALLWLIAGAALALTLIGLPLAVAAWLLVGLWVLYRVARGWLRLNDRKPAPV
ncbi:MAG: hypothetical protein NZ524_00170 [Thiobacillaceae bacterium]|nr:hypothetical protein [Thiobacillaceae bacterium]MCX7672406.1 hypothetical protein [Thiobacillaceae bacterium]MDW8323638.1 hypothetical protein [Burkholderiales bacterium]